MGYNPLDWENKLEDALQQFFAANPQIVTAAGGRDHTNGTPKRFVKYLRNFTNWAGYNPAQDLGVTFPANTDEMVGVYGIEANSCCCHHLLPVLMRVDFAYIPQERLVGLSKIPRFIKALALMPQTQEHLTSRIVDVFSTFVPCLGVAVCVTGVHTCMRCRGVESVGVMRTTKLMGPFLDKGAAREEFFASVKPPQDVRV